MTAEVIHKVDQMGVKVGQGITIVLLLLGFVFNSWVFIAIATVFQLWGAFGLPYAPSKLFYEYVIKSTGLLKPNVQPDNPEPHRFALLVAGIMDGIATLLLISGIPVLPWMLVWIVIVLANLNVWLSFCAGCWMYYQFNRVGVPGFVRSPIQ